MSQEHLASVVELTRTSVTNIEKGRQAVQIHTLLLMAKALGVKASDLCPAFSSESDGVLSSEEDRLLEEKDLSEPVKDWVKKVIQEPVKGDNQ